MNRNYKLKLARVAGVVVTASVLSGVGLATQVGASEAECPSDHICLYGNNDFKWLIGNRENVYVGVRYTLSGDANNETDSWLNKSDNDAAGYDTREGTGDCLTFNSNDKDSNLAFFNSDEVSSYVPGRGC